MPYFAPKPPPVNSLMTRILSLRQLEHLGGLVAHAAACTASRRRASAHRRASPRRRRAFPWARASAPACDIRASTTTSASRKSLLDVCRVGAVARRTAHVALLRQARRGAAAAGGRGLFSRARETQPAHRRCIASSSAVTCGRRSYSTRTSFAASSAARGVVGGHRRDRLTRVANDRVALAWLPVPGSRSCAAMRTRSSTCTARTPGYASAADVSIDLMRACGTVLTTLRAYSMPGSCTSNV